MDPNSHISIDDDGTMHNSTVLPGDRNQELDQHRGSPASPHPDIAVVRRSPLPAFMKEDPEVWFYVIEADFQASNTRSDHVKYSETLRALDIDTLHQITDVLRHPPTTDKYATLKKAILSRTSNSREKQIRDLLTNLRLDDKRPTQLLREMKELAKDSIPEDFLLQLFLDRMPAHARPLLIFGGDKLDHLAQMADKVLETFSGNTVMAVQKTATSSATSSSAGREQFERLERAYRLRLDDVCDRLTSLERAIKGSNKQHRSRSGSGTARQTSKPVEKTICFYHKKYGASAKRCLTPCSFTSNSEN